MWFSYFQGDDLPRNWARVQFEDKIKSTATVIFFLPILHPCFRRVCFYFLSKLEANMITNNVLFSVFGRNKMPRKTKMSFYRLSKTLSLQILLRYSINSSEIQSKRIGNVISHNSLDIKFLILFKLISSTSEIKEEIFSNDQRI